MADCLQVLYRIIPDFAIVVTRLLERFQSSFGPQYFTGKYLRRSTDVSVVVYCFGCGIS
jgi:hypothetical protein